MQPAIKVNIPDMRSAFRVARSPAATTPAVKPVTFSETPQQTLTRAQTMLDSSRAATGFNVSLPPTVPSEALNGNVGVADVRGRRDAIEQQNLATQQFDTDYGNLMGRVQAPLQSTPFQNPQQFIEQTLLRRSTDTDAALNERTSAQAQGFRDLSSDLANTREDAVNQFALPELQANLADTRNRIAERTNMLRTTLRDFETNAERRGVAREFVDSEKQKVQADAAAELADLAIIESAQAGNVQMAQEDIDRAVNAKIQAFEFENAAIETEIKRLEKIDTKESEARAEQLQIALGERNRLIEQSVADEKQKLTYLSEAASNGADTGTLDAIRKSATPGEAALLAGPFIGKLDRQVKNANIAQSYASAAASDANRRKTEVEMRAINSTTTGGDNVAIQALDGFSGSLDQNKREQFTRSVTTSVRRGDTERTEIALKNAAQVAGGSALREDVIKRDQAINALKEVRSALSEYKTSGGDTNLLVGGYEDLQNKLGKTSDPKLAGIETRINLALNAYTNAVSGASFTPQESARYASLFPSTSNTNTLNTTKIDTLVDSFEANNQSFYGNFFGGQTPSQIAEQAVYDELKANATPEQLKEAGITQ